MGAPVGLKHKVVKQKMLSSNKQYDAKGAQRLKEIEASQRYHTILLSVTDSITMLRLACAVFTINEPARFSEC